MYPILEDCLASHLTIAKATTFGLFSLILMRHFGVGDGTCMSMRLMHLRIVAGLLIVDGYVLVWILMRRGDDFVRVCVIALIAWVTRTGLACRAVHVARVREDPTAWKLNNRVKRSVAIIPQ